MIEGFLPDGAGPLGGRRRRRVLLGSILAGSALAVAACTGSGSAGSGSAPSSTEATYGSLPSFLPSDAIEPDSVLTGSSSHPALTTEGDAVDVVLGPGTVRMAVSGPEVPGEGLPHVTAATTCTWTVTISRATAEIPLDVADFSTLDHLGMVYRVVAGPNLPAPPARVEPGATVTFALRAVMPTGEGLMRWAPSHGGTVASWDFEVEND